MRFFRTSPDEIVITDGKTTVLVIAQTKLDDGAKIQDRVHFAVVGYIELEGTFNTYVCGNCDRAGTIFWKHCDECPKEITPR